jgi:hypothetical protein
MDRNARSLTSLTSPIGGQASRVIWRVAAPTLGPVAARPDHVTEAMRIWVLKTFGLRGRANRTAAHARIFSAEN